MSSLKVDHWDAVSKVTSRGRSVAKDIFDIRTTIKGTKWLSQACLDELEKVLAAEALKTKAECIDELNKLLTP